MIDVLSELIVGTEPLEEFRTRLQSAIDTNLEADRRLRTAFEVIIMLETAEAALQRIDTEGFVEQFKQKINETRSNATRILAENASALRTRLEAIETEATELRDELKVRGRCIDDVREEISTYLPKDTTIEELRATANEAFMGIERIVKGAVDTRQGKSFADLEELASNSGSGSTPTPPQPNPQTPPTPPTPPDDPDERIIEIS